MDAINNIDPVKGMKVIGACLLGLNAVALLMNAGATSNMSSQCSVYIANSGSTAATQTFNDPSEYNYKQLTQYVSTNSIPEWINPLWRIPTIDIKDSAGTDTWVVGATVTNAADDQYNSIGVPRVTLHLTEKLMAVDVSEMAFPITLYWTQIEGADMLHILHVQICFSVALCTWAGVLYFLSGRGHEFFQNFHMWSAFILVWYTGTLKTASEALYSPPQGTVIDQIPLAQRNGLAQPCGHAADTGFYLQMLAIFTVLQVPFFVCMRFLGKNNAVAYNKANGTTDLFYVSSVNTGGS